MLTSKLPAFSNSTSNTMKKTVNGMAREISGDTSSANSTPWAV